MFPIKELVKCFREVKMLASLGVIKLHIIQSQFHAWLWQEVF